MTRILFLDIDNTLYSQMAVGFAGMRAPAAVQVMSSGIHPGQRVDPLAVKVMADAGVDIAGAHPQPVSNFTGNQSPDIVVALSSTAARECAMLLPGHPSQVDWNIDDSESGIAPETEEALCSIRDRIRRLVDDFFDRGYFKALTWANHKADIILNSLSEGIIVHDMHRNIVFFNGAAEAITGYARHEVVGRDCHEVFHGNFCGPKCSFCTEDPKFDAIRYPLEIITKTGETRQIEMAVRAIKDEAGTMQGVLASFRDLTHEYELARRLGEVESFSGIIGRDKKMLEVFDLIRSVAAANVPVLIQGASGTGKELVAAAIHNEGPRAGNLFVPVNCGALPEGLLESELFGHVRGAFTGAVRDKKGRFELADGGTIFLDEIGDISPAMQVKLLRVLQENSFERVGDSRTIRVDVRVVSATNKDLKQEIAAGRFREDLYYRLCVVPINLPPLRDRCGDIPLLVEHILERVCREAGREQLAISPAAMDLLLSYEWPGNIRELQNALQFAVVKCREETLEPRHLPPHLFAQRAAATTLSAAGEVAASADPGFVSGSGPAAPAWPISRGHNWHASQAGFPRPAAQAPLPPVGEGRNKLNPEAVHAALTRTDGNKAKAARLLGVGRATLYRFLRKMDGSG